MGAEEEERMQPLNLSGMRSSIGLFCHMNRPLLPHE